MLCAASSVPPRSLSYNPAENAVLVGSDAENGSYELYVVPKEAKGESSPVSLEFSCICLGVHSMLSNTGDLLAELVLLTSVCNVNC